MAANRNLVTLAALLLAAIAPAGPARAADSAFGAREFELCAQCHGPEGAGNPAALAPAIAGLPEWYILTQLGDFKDGLRGLHPDDTGGLRMYPMSQYLRTEADVKAVAAYVAGLPRTHPAPVVEGGDAQKGAALYTPCAACHGPDGGGNEAVKAPPLRGASDWYLLSSLEKFKAGIRGSNPQNVNAALMRGMAQMLTDQQAMKDVVAYIESLSKQTAANAAK